MLDFFHEGGYNMFLLAGLGLVVIAQAVLFARAADPHRLALIRALTVALVFATLVGFAMGLASTAKYVVNHAPDQPLETLLLGFAESTANLILGGAIVVISWVLVAVGVRRMP